MPVLNSAGSIRLAVAALFVLLGTVGGKAQAISSSLAQSYQYEETRNLVTLVDDATNLLRTRGEAAFSDFRVSGSRWREGQTYIFVVDLDGNMLVHPDPAMEGKNELDLRDVDGKPIIRGIIAAATTASDKPDGWRHYQWPVPGEILPRWKSTYARLAVAPSGKRYVVGSGMYTDRMERAFAVDAVKDAVALIEKSGPAAFRLFHDPKSNFLYKDAYVFVYDMNGVNLVLPPFPNLEGRNLLDFTDSQGKKLIRDMIEVVRASGSGWVDYMWPKPGESIPTQKSAFVSKAKMGDQRVLVGCGVYLAEAPKAAGVATKMTAPELMTLVRKAAAVFEEQGEKAYPAFRVKGSEWFRDDTYFFVWTMDGTRVFHAANPEGEGRNVSNLEDILGRPIGKMFLEAVSSPSGEGWAHYMYPEPGNIFPTWKSTFVKRVTFPSGKQFIIGSGIYNMQMDKAFVEDVVNRAAAVVADRGKEAFSQLRDKTGPFLFMDTYVFVMSPDGVELVNPIHPTLEGRNLIGLRDPNGKAEVQEEISMAMKNGGAWLDGYWYKPGRNTPGRKQTFVRKVQSGGDTYIVGSGIYLDQDSIGQ